jgi:hypothetical protein
VGSRRAFPHFQKLEGVPEFVVEIPSLFQRRFIKQKIITGGGGDHDTKANGIGALLIDHLKQIG